MDLFLHSDHPCLHNTPLQGCIPMAETTPLIGKGETPPDRTIGRPTTRHPLDHTFAISVTLHSFDPDPKLARLSSFIITKVTDYNVHGEVKYVKRHASRDLKVETFTCVQVKSLLKLKAFLDIPIEASIPLSENSC